MNSSIKHSRVRYAAVILGVCAIIGVTSQVSHVDSAVLQNTPPRALLEKPYFAVSDITLGDSVSFAGKGFDTEGQIKAYELRLGSCTNGVLLSTSAVSNIQAFKLGTNSVYFRVQDQAGVWSGCQSRIVNTVSRSNIAPKVTVSAPTFAVTNIYQNESIRFAGTATDSDGTIKLYEWRDGGCAVGKLLSSSPSFQATGLSVGTHMISLRAQDNGGLWGNCVVRTAIVAAALGAVTVPVATNSVPSSAISAPYFAVTDIYLGDTVSFTGTETDKDGTVSSYEWRDGSCTNGAVLSTNASFSTNSLATGSHSIYFRAKDNKGAYSTCQSRTVNVARKLTSVTPTPTPMPTPTPTPTPAPVVTSHTKFPSWMKWGMDVGWQASAMSDFEKLTGKQPQMEMVFAHWGNDNFPLEDAPRIRDKGRTMVLFWEAVDYSRPYFSQPEYSFDAVLSGSLDAYFTQFAADAKLYGGEIILAPYSEFNGNWFPWSITTPGNTPAKYIASWRYIHKFFADVPNVKFAWTPNNGSVPNIPSNDPTLAYPGDAYVDIVGVDGFSNTPWESFEQVFGPSLRKYKQYNKPLYILSMGVKDDPRKAAWIKDAFTVELYKYPEVKGWLWFNESKAANWKIDSNPEALKAFIDMIP